MSQSTRRAFLGQIGSAAIAIPALGDVPFAVGPEPSQASASAQAAAASPQASASASYDLLIAGGRVVDPSQKLSAERDVAIAKGKIARVDSNIPRNQALQVVEARGRLVTPGLINIHTHCYNYGLMPLSVDPDIVGIPMGVTTMVDAGSMGAMGFLGFRKYVIERSATRVYALLNISTMGLMGPELYQDLSFIDPKAAIRVVEENRDCLLGIKVRVNGKHSDLPRDLEAMKRAREAADATGLPIMMHWSNEPELLALLKRGDTMSHPFNPPTPNTSNLLGGEMTQGDKVLPQILALKDRGIWTDGQTVSSHHQWQVAEKALSQGWFPDAISTDLGRGPLTPQGVYLLATMSQALFLGLSVDQVIACVTTNPAKMLKYPDKIGTLEPGATADVTILDIAQGNFEFVDSVRQTRVGHQKFVHVATVKSGILKTIVQSREA
jgi:dihydroorotase